MSEQENAAHRFLGLQNAQEFQSFCEMVELAEMAEMPASSPPPPRRCPQCGSVQTSTGHRYCEHCSAQLF